MQIGRTETLKSNANPQFAKSIEVEYFFQEAQRVRFDVYDIDSKSMKLTDDDHLGYIEATLGEVGLFCLSHLKHLATNMCIAIARHCASVVALCSMGTNKLKNCVNYCSFLCEMRCNL